MFFFFQDLRYVIRQLWKDRAIAIVVTVTIALGIGVNTAVFSILNGFQRPLPVTAPEQIVVLAADTKGDETGFRFTFSYAALEDIRRQADLFTDIFAFVPGIGGLSTGDKSTQFLYSAVTGNFFSALGLHPAHGRLFAPAKGKTWAPS
jgi:ABC-type lipoprotein release transport system permease subunit